MNDRIAQGKTIWLIKAIQSSKSPIICNNICMEYTLCLPIIAITSTTIAYLHQASGTTSHEGKYLLRFLTMYADLLGMKDALWHNWHTVRISGTGPVKGDSCMLHIKPGPGLYGENSELTRQKQVLFSCNFAFKPSAQSLDRSQHISWAKERRSASPVR